MKSERTKSLGQKLAALFSLTELYMGLVEMGLVALVVTFLDDWEEMICGILLTMLACEIARLALGMRLNHRLTHKALTPLRSIAEKVRHITSNNLNERLDPCGGEEELTELTCVLNDMLGRIESGYNAQKQFMSDASHELRTPIAVIQGYADMLDRWGKSDPAVMEESIAAIRTETAGMKELVEQLLFIARHEGDACPYQMEYWDAAELIEELARDTRLIDSDHEIKVLVSEKCVVRADRAAIKQALRIFIDNAIKYTPAGGHIALGCMVEKKNCRLTVADDGCGIAREDLEHVFERFYRSASARGSNVDGHGLGLAIVRLIVRAHGGRIEAQSKPGGGSRFHILLPK